MGKHMRWFRAAIWIAGITALTTACNNGPRVTAVTSTRFEVATASVVLGAKQLLLDTSNGDVWWLEGERSGDAEWVLLARGPEDVREPLSQVLSEVAQELRD